MKLTELPNIGPVLADNLKKVGVETPEALRSLGAEEIWLRIRLQVDAGACLHQLQALAGAEAGVPKKELPPERKAALKSFFNSHK
ncbi:TfoX/Sxy family DNA transformation protein [Vermiculatibacterium agrestimuris]|uniref:TfoX/Sxy family DNA transformation protein n=1 Tax=Vermiculatibacterium agrestimuris TaxID=2941519 RepID=UPI002041610E|nr:TfoX/Sxy family DNA transformation protein [Vermiculatibacterium agrestimuris]